jgi:hypothetical protein
MYSCVRETITGGTVTIGTDQSEVKAGKVTRTSSTAAKTALDRIRFVRVSMRLTAAGIPRAA